MLPTKQDLETQTERIEAALHREIEEIKSEMSQINKKVDKLEQQGLTFETNLRDVTTKQARLEQKIHQLLYLVADIILRSGYFLIISLNKNSVQ